MLIKNIKLKVLSLLMILCSGATIAADLSGYKNIPAGWRTEVIPFPLEFAPEIKLNGVEELIFAPGMYKADQQDFFSYAFVWAVQDVALSHQQLKYYLESYYLGLYKAVAQQSSGKVQVELNAVDEDWGYQGNIRWVEPFVTKQAQVIRFKARLQACQMSAEKRWYFMVSPQDDSHEIWTKLKSLQTTSC